MPAQPECDETSKLAPLLEQEPSPKLSKSPPTTSYTSSQSTTKPCHDNLLTKPRLFIGQKSSVQWQATSNLSTVPVPFKKLAPNNQLDVSNIRGKLGSRSPQSSSPSGTSQNTPNRGGSISMPFVAVSRMKGRLGQWKKRAAERREKRALATLFAILATFAICWLPFFLMALIVPLCGPKCQPSRVLGLLIDWLGYFNSTLNPIVYALMNDDMRQAFTKLMKRRA